MGKPQAAALQQPSSEQPLGGVLDAERIVQLEQQVAELSAGFAALTAYIKRIVHAPGCGLVDLSARQSCTEFTLSIRESVKPDAPLRFSNATINTFQVVQGLTRKLLENGDG